MTINKTVIDAVSDMRQEGAFHAIQDQSMSRTDKDAIAKEALPAIAMAAINAVGAQGFGGLAEKIIGDINNHASIGTILKEIHILEKLSHEAEELVGGAKEVRREHGYAPLPHLAKIAEPAKPIVAEKPTLKTRLEVTDVKHEHHHIKPDPVKKETHKAHQDAKEKSAHNLFHHHP